jgi:transposase
VAKYSFEFKKMIVKEYLEGKGSTHELAKRHHIGNGDNKQVVKWVAAYNEFGDDGLLRSRQQKKYSFEYKLHVVELYLSSEVSYQELALSQGINNPAMIAKWVNDFRIVGPDALRPKKKGRKKSLESNKKATTIARTVDETPVGTNTERVKQLEDELLKLRIENAYLKELRRLRLEEETLLKKQRESSTASEENSN